MDVQEQIEQLAANGPKEVNILTRTVAKTYKGCPYKEVFRLTEREVEIGKTYQEAVNEQRRKEGKPPDFAPVALWNGLGERVPGCKNTYRHKNTLSLYIGCSVKRTVSEVWTDELGNEIPYDKIKPWLTEKDYGNPRQGLEKEVGWRVFLVERVVAVYCRGNK